jgi:hypothetical protein
MGGQLRRILGLAPSADGSAPDWPAVYAECADAVRSFERTVDTLDRGVVRDRLHALGSQLPPLLGVAERVAKAAADAPDDPATPLRGERLTDLRTALRGMAADCQRIAGLLRTNPPTDDLADRLRALATHLASARSAAR